MAVMRFFFKGGRLVSAVILLQVLWCAQIQAGNSLGQRNAYFRDRVLSHGSADYHDYLGLQKMAAPAIGGYCNDHGDPDFIVPGFGSSCDMVWVEQNETVSPTVFGGIDVRAGVPDRVVEYKKIVDDRRQLEMTRKMKEGADVGGFTVKSMTYDSASRKGRVSILVANGNFDMARVWARNYISTLAKDKNVALVSGKLPDNAKFYLGDEIIIDGKLLEVEFETE